LQVRPEAEAEAEGVSARALLDRYAAARSEGSNSSHYHMPQQQSRFEKRRKRVGTEDPRRGWRSCESLPTDYLPA